MISEPKIISPEMSDKKQRSYSVSTTIRFNKHTDVLRKDMVRYMAGYPDRWPTMTSFMMSAMASFIAYLRSDEGREFLKR